MTRQYTIVYDDTAADQWSDVLELCDEAIETFTIPLASIHLHGKPERDTDPLGYSDIKTNTVHLFAPDKNILLHELAHIHSREQHTSEWADTYVAFMYYFFRDHEFAEAMRTAHSMYDVVARTVIELAANEYINESSRWTWGTPLFDDDIDQRETKVRKRSTGMIVTGKGTVRQHNDRREKTRSKRKG